MAEAERSKREKVAKEMEHKKKQEESEMKQLDPHLLVILEQMLFDKTPLEVTLQGLKLGPIRSEMVARHLAKNTSLLAIDMTRLGIEDAEGQILAKMLRKNTSLRKLDLEGNLLGP